MRHDLALRTDVFTILNMRTIFVSAISLALVASAGALDFKSTMLTATDVRTQTKVFLPGGKVKAIMFVGFLSGCPLFAKYQSTLKKLKHQFGEQLLIVNYDPDQNKEMSLGDKIESLKKLDNDFPLVADPNGELNGTLGVTIASETAIVRVSDYKLIYRGAIDDRLTLDFERPKSRNDYARLAIDLAIGGKDRKIEFTTASGCALNTKSSRQ